MSLHADPAAFARRNLSAPEERRRVSAVALNVFLTIARAWALTNAEAAALLGVSVSTLARIKRGRRPLLRQDQVSRIGAMLAMFKGLHAMYADHDADDWPLQPNDGALFGGRMPIDAMIEGGLPRMLDIRRHVDAMRGVG